MVLLKLIPIFALFYATNALPLEDRVIGGENADPEEYPYMISLKKYGSHSCGGTIITSNCVLTAAHCVSGSSTSNMQIQYGSNVLSSSSPNITAVNSYKVHENYNNGLGLYANDVATICTSTNMPFWSGNRPITLPAQGTVPPASNICILTGWGYTTTENQVIPANLQEVNITLYTDAGCNDAHGANYDKGTHVCAGVPEGGKGQCNGDSGGPLACNGIQTGIVSWSRKPCTIAGYPGVYTRVSSFTDWIQDSCRLCNN